MFDLFGRSVGKMKNFPRENSVENFFAGIPKRFPSLLDPVGDG